VTDLDPIYRFAAERGRAWPHDIALDADGSPVVLYTRRLDDRDTFFYARFDGMRWTSREIVAAGRGRRTFTSGGGGLDHADPRTVLLSRRVGELHQIEAWTTRDGGRSWDSRRLTSHDDGFAMRPVAPRGASPLELALYVWGDPERTRSYTDFLTRIRAVAVPSVT
jgi:hypothetical protein